MIDRGALVAVGRTSHVYEYGANAVVKVPRPEVPRHWASEEARFTAAVRDLGAPAPDVLDVITVDDRDAIVFERVSGQTMWESILAAPSEVDRWGRRLAEVHRRILAAGLPRRIDGLVARMRMKIEAAVQLSEAERSIAQQIVERLPRGGALLHGDLHPGNVLMSPTGPVVIDWFDAAIGHPIADVTRSLLLIRPAAGGVDKPHLPGADPALLSRLNESYRSAMVDVLDRPADELAQWEAVVAVSRLAEKAEADDEPLLALWRNSADQVAQ